MAFPSAAGHGNLPQGNFSPVIYSKKAQIAFRKSSVVQAITNTDYYGEISDYGDTVKIIKEPQLTVKAYTRGQQIQAEDLDDDEITLTVDKANYFAFKVDDIESKQAHLNWESLASNNAGYKLRDTFDSEVLTYIQGQVPTAQQYGTASSVQPIDFAGTNPTPLQYMNRLARFLDSNNVPAEGRWFVADPVFWEKMSDENSKLMDYDFSRDQDSIIRNGKVTEKKIRGFECYMSNNLPTVGTGPTATSGTNGGWVLAGHMSAVATAEQIRKTESYRDPDSFADVVRGLHLYGRKALRTPALVGGVYRSS